MDTTKLTFRCPVNNVARLDEIAEADHRDRSSMLNKIVATYISQHKPDNNGDRPTAAPRKKAGTR
jgi:predicted transcriptional regulator